MTQDSHEKRLRWRCGLAELVKTAIETLNARRYIVDGNVEALLHVLVREQSELLHAKAKTLKLVRPSLICSSCYRLID